MLPRQDDPRLTAQASDGVLFRTGFAPPDARHEQPRHRLAARGHDDFLPGLYPAQVLRKSVFQLTDGDFQGWCSMWSQ